MTIYYVLHQDFNCSDYGEVKYLGASNDDCLDWVKQNWKSYYIGQKENPIFENIDIGGDCFLDIKSIESNIFTTTKVSKKKKENNAPEDITAQAAKHYLQAIDKLILRSGVK